MHCAVNILKIDRMGKNPCPHENLCSSFSSHKPGLSEGPNTTICPSIFIPGLVHPSYTPFPQRSTEGNSDSNTDKQVNKAAQQIEATGM